MQAHHLVGNDGGQEARRPGGVRIELGETRHRLDDVVIGGLIRIRTILAQAGRGAMNKAAVHALRTVNGKAQL